MAAFPKQTLTGDGLALLAKAGLGTELKFTKLGMGDGAAGQTPARERTSLQSLKQEVAVTRKRRQGESSYTIGGYFTNQALTQGFTWREMGVYALDPDKGEILYSYANAGEAGDYIPTLTDGRIEKYLYVTTSVSGADNVTAEINQSDVYALLTDITASSVTSTVLPEAPTEGLTWYQPQTQELKLFLGGGWRDYNTSKLYISQTQPAGAKSGAIWYNPTTGELKLYVEQQGFISNLPLCRALTGDLALLQTRNKANLVEAMNEVFTNVSNGKSLVAAAVIDIGGYGVSGGSTFAQLANEIRNCGVTTTEIHMTSGTWTAPRTTAYTITCIGAGGDGDQNRLGGSSGGFSQSELMITKGEQVALTIGGRADFGGFLSAGPGTSGSASTQAGGTARGGNIINIIGSKPSGRGGANAPFANGSSGGGGAGSGGTGYYPVLSDLLAPAGSGTATDGACLYNGGVTGGGGGYFSGGSGVYGGGSGGAGSYGGSMVGSGGGGGGAFGAGGGAGANQYCSGGKGGAAAIIIAYKG